MNPGLCPHGKSKHEACREGVCHRDADGSEPKPTVTVNDDGTVTGFDPGHGDEMQAECTMRRLPDGTIEVLDVKTWPRPASPT